MTVGVTVGVEVLVCDAETLADAVIEPLVDAEAEREAVVVAEALPVLDMDTVAVVVGVSVEAAVTLGDPV